MNASRRRRWPWLVVLAVLALAAIVVLRFTRARPAPLDPALIVSATRGPFEIEVVETGKVVPRERVELKSKVAGQAIAVLVEEGGHVKKGQLVIVLDPSDYQREVARAAADVELARNGLAFARLTVDRKQAGVAAQVTPLSELDAARADLGAKVASLRSAEVALGSAQDRVRYTKIVSPLDGTVIQRGVQPGEVVVPGVQSTFEGKALLTVADLTTLVVKIELNQIDVARVKLGQLAELTLDALPGKVYQARVTRIAPAAVRAVGRDIDVFPVEAELASADPEVLPGMTADVRIQLEEKADVLALPIEALTKENGKTFVSRVIDDPKGPRTEKVEVVTGARNDRDVEIVAGLDEGDRVLLNPPSAAENETRM